MVWGGVRAVYMYDILSLLFIFACIFISFLSLPLHIFRAWNCCSDSPIGITVSPIGGCYCYVMFYRCEGTTLFGLGG